MLRKKLSRIEELKRRLYQEENTAKHESWKKIMRRKIRIHYEIRFDDYKNDWNLLRIQKSSNIMTHRAVMAVLTFLIKLIFLRVPERPRSEPRTPRITRACMSISGDVSDWHLPM